MITPTTSTDYGTATRPTTTSAGYAYGDRPFARVSWGSIFAGALIAMAIQLVLTLIGAAIGMATLDPGTGDNPSATALGVGAAIWLLVSSVISLFAGGYIAARLGGTFNGWLHGLTTWAVVTMLTMILLSSAVGGLIGTASGLANFAAGANPAEARRATRQAADRTTARANDPATAEAAANRGAAGTGGAALGLILGAVAAAFGGRKGERDLGRRDAFASSGASAGIPTRS
jgi:hypothetical protein